MQRSGPQRGLLYGWRGAVLLGVLILPFTAKVTQGQDVTEAPRQERARKAEQQKPAPHVYTEEDLKRATILTPEDQAKVEARKKQQSVTPAEQNATVQPVETNPQQESLGEVARRYRREKAAHAAEEARKKSFTPFRYGLGGPALAEPKPVAPVRVETSPRLDRSESVTPNVATGEHSPGRGAHKRERVSPFQPRPGFDAVPTLRLAPGVSPAAPRSVSPAFSTPMVAGSAARLRQLQVQRGDCWWKLAARYLGSGARWNELRALNGETNVAPELLRAGSVVVVPEAGKSREKQIAKQIIVKKGDSLWSLARTYLGHGSAWRCLAQANPQISDYTRMAIGAKLEVPESAAPHACLPEQQQNLKN